MGTQKCRCHFFCMSNLWPGFMAEMSEQDKLNRMINAWKTLAIGKQENACVFRVPWCSCSFFCSQLLSCAWVVYGSCIYAFTWEHSYSSVWALIQDDFLEVDETVDAEADQKLKEDSIKKHTGVVCATQLVCHEYECSWDDLRCLILRKQFLIMSLVFLRSLAVFEETGGIWTLDFIERAIKTMFTTVNDKGEVTNVSWPNGFFSNVSVESSSEFCECCLASGRFRPCSCSSRGTERFSFLDEHAIGLQDTSNA